VFTKGEVKKIGSNDRIEFAEAISLTVSTFSVGDEPSVAHEGYPQQAP
jgi:hypothetical protein